MTDLQVLGLSRVRKFSIRIVNGGEAKEAATGRFRPSVATGVRSLLHLENSANLLAGLVSKRPDVTALLMLSRGMTPPILHEWVLESVKLSTVLVGTSGHSLEHKKVNSNEINLIESR